MVETPWRLNQGDDAIPTSNKEIASLRRATHALLRSQRHNAGILHENRNYATIARIVP